MSRSTSRGQRIILANASAPASPTILFLRQLLAPATHFLPEQQGRTSPMKCLAVTALLLVVAAPGLAQAPSDNPWTSSETKTDADAQAKAMHERLDLDRDGYVTVDEVDRFAKLETGATGNSNARVAALSGGFSCSATAIMMGGSPWPKVSPAPMLLSRQWTPIMTGWSRRTSAGPRWRPSCSRPRRSGGRLLPTKACAP
jgi:hypothetical protein